MSVITRWLTFTLCALCLTTTPAVAERQKASTSVSKPKKKAASRGVRLKAPPKVTYADWQTAAQRQRSEAARLRRECKGRPDAGACLGYAR